jgi:hypothetical protein
VSALALRLSLASCNSGGGGAKEMDSFLMDASGEGVLRDVMRAAKGEICCPAFERHNLVK